MTQGLAIPDAALGLWREGLGNGGTIGLKLTISVYNAIGHIPANLRIEAEDDYKRYLDEHPLQLQPTGKPA